MRCSKHQTDTESINEQTCWQHRNQAAWHKSLHTGKSLEATSPQRRRLAQNLYAHSAVQARGRTCGHVMRRRKDWNEEALSVSVFSTRRSAKPPLFSLHWSKLAKLTKLILKERKTQTQLCRSLGEGKKMGRGELQVMWHQNRERQMNPDLQTH